MEVSGLTNLTPGPEPAAAPSPGDTLSLEVESWVRQAGKVDKWIVQFIAPCLVQWKFILPWVRPSNLHPLLPVHALLPMHALDMNLWSCPLLSVDYLALRTVC